LSIVIGIDPGLSGAIAFIPRQGESWVEDMPVLTLSATGFVKRALNPHGLSRILRAHVSSLDLDPVNPVVFIERVNAFPGQGVASMFSLGMSFWGAFSVAATLAYETRLVEPKDWKRHFHLAKDKDLARGMAQRLFPHIDLSRVKDHGRAEALLIAAYGRHLLKEVK
jgi:crossover junction endodeoxyribonuclease RuvC